jgi:hypothetical protein
MNRGRRSSTAGSDRLIPAVRLDRQAGWIEDDALVRNVESERELVVRVRAPLWCSSISSTIYVYG